MVELQPIGQHKPGRNYNPDSVWNYEQERQLRPVHVSHKVSAIAEPSVLEQVDDRLPPGKGTNKET